MAVTGVALALGGVAVMLHGSVSDCGGERAAAAADEMMETPIAPAYALRLEKKCACM